jgi:hypothetical protein
LRTAVAQPARAAESMTKVTFFIDSLPLRNVQNKAGTVLFSGVNTTGRPGPQGPRAVTDVTFDLSHTRPVFHRENALPAISIIPKNFR